MGHNSKQTLALCRTYSRERQGSRTGVVLHVKQTQPRNPVLLQDSFLYVLFVQLLDLGSGHLAAVGSEIAIGILAYLEQDTIRR